MVIGRKMRLFEETLLLLMSLLNVAGKEQQQVLLSYYGKLFKLVPRTHLLVYFLTECFHSNALIVGLAGCHKLYCFETGLVVTIKELLRHLLSLINRRCLLMVQCARQTTFLGHVVMIL